MNALRLLRKRFFKAVATAVGIAVGIACQGQNLNLARYAWGFPRTTNIIGADRLIEELRAEVQRVLDAGRLAPLYISYSDQESVGYTVYQEPGRIVTTLAWAYPHLTSVEQTGVRAYIRDEFNNPTNAPWGVTAYGKNGNCNYPLPHNAGVPREDHPRDQWWFERRRFGASRPFLHTLYGVWLSGFRTGEWTTISNHWPEIKMLYAYYGKEDAYRLYGTMGTHVAMARLAHKFGDADIMAAALTNLQERLEAGLDFSALETCCRGAPGDESRSPYGSFPNMYDSRMDHSTYRGWMFLNLTPEVGRYLNEASLVLRSNVLARHTAGKAAFPLWWIPKASYFNRSWTGDEGSGLVPEVFGMIAPVERWVVQADAASLANEMRSAPNGRGDCYWLEALVQAIEAHGALQWIDVRN